MSKKFIDLASRPSYLESPAPKKAAKYYPTLHMDDHLDDHEVGQERKATIKYKVSSKEAHKDGRKSMGLEITHIAPYGKGFIKDGKAVTEEDDE